MDAKTIIIIALLVFGYFWYTSPDKATNIIDDGVDKVKTVIGNVQDQDCPDTIDYVCGDNGITYNNQCLADKAGVNSTTPGECI